MRTLKSLLWLLVVATALIAMPSQASNASNKWRIAVDHAAKIDGEVEFSFVPEGGTASSLVVPIPSGTHENQAAHLIRDAIRNRYGRDVYHVELDDGEDVLVKVRHHIPDVEIILVRNTAEGLSFHLSRE
ncbi:hypothetical protein [Stenotrophomonas sp. SY1]|uniref:hypothetical protein n=1 Tax=Stenotrophomonas sp. SY1 TaxID=477235 RepID=UPI001E510956|nr:hypothetical protein [Stenotrophomonas sp. SY1]MCD9086998.1 hypothetical protein [Stenotrophomonas sp. SY1]